jgi:D-lactate dehydrogenase
MDDKQRLADFRRRLQALDGLDEERFLRLNAELERVVNQPGHDDQGRFRVAFFDAKRYDIEAFDRANDGRFAPHYIRTALSLDTVHAAAGTRAVCVFVNDTCDAAVLEALASMGVELVALRCAGFNNVDLQACRELGLSIARVPVYSPHAVAEYTVALMLMLNRHLHLAYQRNRTGYFVLDGLTGFDMRGKAVGVVGTGQIGQCVVDILLGFGCRILAYDKFPNQRLAGLDQVSYVPLDDLLANSDIVTLHVPLFPETYHLIDRESIDRMRDGVMLINTSRGGLVDTVALIHGLKSGKIGLAGLDVYEEETGIFFNDVSDRVMTDDVLARLLTFNNVVVTSHQAFLTHEALDNIAATTLANLDEYLSGKRGESMTHAVPLPPEG